MSQTEHYSCSREVKMDLSLSLENMKEKNIYRLRRKLQKMQQVFQCFIFPKNASFYPNRINLYHIQSNI